MKLLIRLILVAALIYALFTYSPQIVPQIKPVIDRIPQTLAKINLPLKFWPQVQEMGEGEDSQVLGTNDISQTISQTQQDLIESGREKIEEVKTNFINSLVDKFYEALINKLETERAKTSVN